MRCLLGCNDGSCCGVGDPALPLPEDISFESECLFLRLFPVVVGAGTCWRALVSAISLNKYDKLRLSSGRHMPLQIKRLQHTHLYRSFRLIRLRIVLWLNFGKPLALLKPFERSCYGLGHVWRFHRPAVKARIVVNDQEYMLWVAR